MRMWKRLLAACLLATMTAGLAAAPACAAADYRGKHGTAKFIGGRTVIVSIFADDMNTSWDFPLSGSQKKLYNKIHKRMGIGLEWLEKQVARYGVTTEFVWDFDKYDGAGGLCRYASFSEDLINGGWDSYLALWDYIDKNGDTDQLLADYGADNIIYAVHLNAPNSKDYRSFVYCANDAELTDQQIYYEVAIFVPYGHDRENTPAVYAHELLHCFGAVDLYYAGKRVPQAYVDHLEKTKAFDLMNRCYYSKYDRVTTAFSDVDAYFVGLLDTCDDVEKYGLGPNIFEEWGY